MSLLRPHEPRPFVRRSGNDASPFLLTVDHASQRIPEALGTLGLSTSDLDRHIAWDIGARGLAERLADRLEATCFFQEYSRLVIDANRPLSSPSSIVLESEATAIPGNLDLSPDEIRARRAEVFFPYHHAIEREVMAREERGARLVLVTVHSFTPVYFGRARAWEAGILYHPRDPRLAAPLLEELRDAGRTVGDNEPYSVSDDSDYGVLVYGERRGHLNVELEVRQDLVATTEGQREWADLLADCLERALARVGAG